MSQKEICNKMTNTQNNLLQFRFPEKKEEMLEMKCFKIHIYTHTSIYTSINL